MWCDGKSSCLKVKSQDSSVSLWCSLRNVASFLRVTKMIELDEMIFGIPFQVYYFILNCSERNGIKQKKKKNSQLFLAGSPRERTQMNLE